MTKILDRIATAISRQSSRAEHEQNAAHAAPGLQPTDLPVSAPLKPDPERVQTQASKFLQSQPKNYIPSIVIAGSPGIGKDCLMIRLANRVYAPGFDPTASDREYRRITLSDRHFDVEITTLSVNPQASTTYNYPTTSTHRFIVLAYNVGDRNSFEAMRLIYEQTLGSTNEHPSRVSWAGGVVASLASDLSETFYRSDLEPGQDFARSKGLEFITISAKTGQGCEDADLVGLVTSLLAQAAHTSSA